MRARSSSTSPLRLGLGLGLSLAFALPQPDALAASPEPAEQPAASPEPEPSSEPEPEPEPAEQPESVEAPAPEPESAPAPGPAPEPEPEPEPPPTASPQPTPIPPPAAPVEVDPKHYAMVLSGDIIIGLGGATLLTSLVGLGIRSDARSQRAGLVAADADADALARQDQRIQTGTYLAIGGGAATVALFATGITLVALGYARDRKRRLELPQAAVGRHGASLSWTLHF